MSDSRPNGMGAPANDIADRVNQLKADLERIQTTLRRAETDDGMAREIDHANGVADPAVPPPFSGKPIQELRPPDYDGNRADGNRAPNEPDLVTMKVKVPRQQNVGASSPADLVTMRVKVPRSHGAQQDQRPPRPVPLLDPDLVTMKVKVPRSNPVDPAIMGQAIAQSLDSLNQATPDVMNNGDLKRRHSGGPLTEAPRKLEESLDDEEDFIPDEAPKLGRELSLRDVFFMVRERWLLGVALGLLFAAGYAYWMLNIPPTYRSSAELLIKLKPDNVLPVEGVNESLGGGGIDSAMEIHRKTLLSSAYTSYLDSEHFTTPEGQPTPLKQEYLKGLMRASDVVPSDGDGQDLSQRMFDWHFTSGANIDVDRKKSQPFLEVAYRHPVPETAQKMANVVANSYNKFLLEANKKAQKDAKEFVESSVQELKVKIQDAERDIQLHRQKHNLFESERGEGSRASEAADTLETQIQDAQMNIVRIESQLELIKVQDRSNVEQLSQQSFIAEFGPVAATQKLLSENRQEFAQLDVEFGPRWPGVVANRAARKDLLAQLARNVELAIRTTESNLEKLKDELVRLRDNQKAAEKQSLGVNNPILQLKEKQSILELDKKSFESMQNRLNEMEISEKLVRTTVEVMRPAIFPRQPVDPDRSRVAQVATLIFLATFLGVPVGLGFLDNRLKSFSEAEAFLGKECLGVIPERPRLDTVELGQAVLEDGDEKIVESFRVILGSIDLSSRVPTPKVIVTTSAGPSEGKSFVSANLAAMLARHGKRCLIVDCDLRKPSQHKLAGVKNDAGLLTWHRAGTVVPQTPEAVMSDLDLGILRLDSAAHLFLLRAGGSSRSPSELITNAKFEQLLGMLRNIFDIIILDTPPVGLFSDSLFLANYAEEAVYVCKHNGLNRHKIKFGLRKMERCHCEVLGVVMNQLSASRRHQYGYGYRDYGYGSYGSKDYADYYAKDDEGSKTRRR